MEQKGIQSSGLRKIFLALAFVMTFGFTINAQEHAMHFSGSPEKIVITTGEPLYIYDIDFTIEFWVRNSEPTTNTLQAPNTKHHAYALTYVVIVVVVLVILYIYKNISYNYTVASTSLRIQGGTVLPKQNGNRSWHKKY